MSEIGTDVLGAHIGGGSSGIGYQISEGGGAGSGGIGYQAGHRS
jgi:hypothetical protein